MIIHFVRWERVWSSNTLVGFGFDVVVVVGGWLFSGLGVGAMAPYWIWSMEIRYRGLVVLPRLKVYLQDMAFLPKFALIFDSMRTFEGLLASSIQSSSSADD